MKYKKARNLKELKNHPLVDEVWKEGQDGIFDDYDEVYWLTLKVGYWFEAEQSALIQTRPIVKELLAEFNFGLIGVDPRVK